LKNILSRGTRRVRWNALSSAGAECASREHLMHWPDRTPWVHELFRVKYGPLMRFLLSRLPRREDAEDLAQEAFLRLLRVPQTDLIRQPDAYLFRIAANLVIEFRMRARRAVVSFDSEQAERESGVAESVSEAEQLLDGERLQQAIESLPAKPRAALIMQRRDGLTYAQIGVRLGVSPDMVKKYLASAIARCRLTLGEDR
jgi:RNA polymerase sigma factor (sigma-70 family)